MEQHLWTHIKATKIEQELPTDDLEEKQASVDELPDGTKDEVIKETVMHGGKDFHMCNMCDMVLRGAKNK